MGKQKDYIEEFCKDNNIQSGDIIQSSFEDIKMCRLYANHKTLRPTELGVEGVWFGTNHARGVLYNLMTGKYDYKIIRKGSKKLVEFELVETRDEQTRRDTGNE